MIADAGLSHWIEVVFVGFSTVNLLIFLYFYIEFWKEVNTCCTHLMNMGLSFTSSKVLNLCNLFLILLYGGIFHFSLPIYLFIHSLFISILIRGYLFDNLGYKPIMLYFLAQIVSVYSFVKCFLKIF